MSDISALAPSRIAVFDPVSQAINSLFSGHLVGADLADGSTGAWTPRNGAPSWVLGGTMGDDGVDEPTVASGVVSFTGGSEVVAGPAGYRPGLDVGDEFTLMVETAPDLTGDVTQVLVGMSNSTLASLQGFSLLVLPATPVIRARFGSGGTAVNVNVTPIASETVLVFVRISGVRGADGLTIDQFRVAASPTQSSVSTASIGDATPNSDMAVGRVPEGTGSNYEGTIRRLGYVSELRTYSELQTIADLLGYAIT